MTGVEVAGKFASAVGMRKLIRGNKRKIEDEEKAEEKEKEKAEEEEFSLYSCLGSFTE